MTVLPFGRGKGRLIVLDGGEGVGKSTQIRRLEARLARLGLTPLALREPGGTPLGERVRELLLKGEDMTPAAEALLFMTSRAELVAHVVRPALDRGAVVLLDRFFLSTYAYQIAGRGLPEADVRAANHLATGGLVPDLTLLLRLPASEGLTRAARRGGQDRIESSGDAFHARVESAFAGFADPAWLREHPEVGPVVPVDAGGSEEAVEERLATELARRWPETFAPQVESHH